MQSRQTTLPLMPCISVVVKELKVETQGRGQGRGLENWSSRILEDKDFLEDNNTAVRQYSEIDMNLNLTGAQWQISHQAVTQSLQDDGA